MYSSSDHRRRIWSPAGVCRSTNAPEISQRQSVNSSAVLIVLCGLSFSGKSTVGQSLTKSFEASVVTLDAINEERGLQCGQGISLAEWRATNDLAHERTEKLLRAGVCVVIDDSSSPRFLRDEWRTTASAIGARFGLVYVHADPQMIRNRVCLNREDLTRPDVIDAVINEHTAQFEPPAIDEPHHTIESTNSNNEAEVSALVARISAIR